jgi:phosphatidylserine decarboxylase
MPIHQEGHSLLAALAVVLLVIVLGGVALLPTTLASGLLIIALVVLAFFAQFFRNPRRVPPANGIVSPADGTIVAIEPVQENEYFQDERLKISIYMSAFDVHLNRVPLNGSVIYSRYHPGQYLVAFHPKASELNERNTVVIEGENGQRVLLRQIAGILARRIRTYIQVGQQVCAGDELGFIKFGSRCDIFLPLGTRVLVQMQQKVRGGETLLAQFP